MTSHFTDDNGHGNHEQGPEEHRHDADRLGVSARHPVPEAEEDEQTLRPVDENVAIQHGSVPPGSGDGQISALVDADRNPYHRQPEER
jgi:nitrogen fixation protein FixH